MSARVDVPSKFGTLLKWLILLPVLAVVLLLAIANDQSVSVHLNPFDTDDPLLRADLALYQIGFMLFVLGALVGGLVVWSGQRKYRRRARRRGEDVALWQAKAERSEFPHAEVRPSSSATAFLPGPRRS